MIKFKTFNTYQTITQKYVFFPSVLYPFSPPSFQYRPSESKIGGGRAQIKRISLKKGSRGNRHTIAQQKRNPTPCLCIVQHLSIQLYFIILYFVFYSLYLILVQLTLLCLVVYGSLGVNCQCTLLPCCPFSFQVFFYVPLSYFTALYIHLYSPKTVEICELYSYTKINNMLK